MKSLNNKKFLGSVILGAFVITGLYNAVVMNSDSNLTDMKLAKRLDEIYGVTTQGRQVASQTTWSKITPVIVKTGTFQVAPAAASFENKVAEAVVSDAAITEELTLNLIEVVNPQKWKQGLATSQFNGSLIANNGLIESLSVSLPDGQGVSISFSEMNGNVFNYEMNGQEFAGMLYQIDQNAYMVTLTNGPLEGTRLRFGGEATSEVRENIQQNLAENNIEAGTFGSQDAQVVEDSAPKADVKTAGFNFGEVI
jgi:hypothetical protein